MARLPRYVLPGQSQHIIQRGNNRQVIFASDTDFQFFHDAMVSASDQYGLASHAGLSPRCGCLSGAGSNFERCWLGHSRTWQAARVLRAK